MDPMFDVTSGNMAFGVGGNNMMDTAGNMMVDTGGNTAMDMQTGQMHIMSGDTDLGNHADQIDFNDDW